MKKPQRYPIALNLPAIVALLIVFARHVVQAMTGNTWFTTPVPSLATITADVDALEAAEAAVLSRTKGASQARDVKWKIVVDDLMALKAYVATIVSLNIGQAAAIIESAGMMRKRFTARQKEALAALMGPALGQIRLVAKAAARHAAYEWAVSTDGGKTWVAVALTNVAHTSYLGATPGSTYQFRVRSTVKGVTSDWSQIISFLAT